MDQRTIEARKLSESKLSEKTELGWEEKKEIRSGDWLWRMADFYASVRGDFDADSYNMVITEEPSQIKTIITPLRIIQYKDGEIFSGGDDIKSQEYYAMIVHQFLGNIFLYHHHRDQVQQQKLTIEYNVLPPINAKDEIRLL